MKIIYWPCGTWCFKENLEEYNYMSDDYTELELNEPAVIDEVVKNILTDEVKNA